MKLEEAITKRIYDLCAERDIVPNKLLLWRGYRHLQLGAYSMVEVKIPVRGRCLMCVRR